MQKASKTRALEALLGSATINVNVNLALALNSMPAAVLLSQMMFWQFKARFKNLETFSDRSGNDRDYFAKSAADWKQETALTDANITSAREILARCGILHERLKGGKVSTQMFYSVDIDAVVSVVQNYLSTGERVCEKVGHKGKKLSENFRKKTELDKIENGQNVPNPIFTESVKIENTVYDKIENTPIILLESNIESENTPEKIDFKVQIFEPVKEESVTINVAAAGENCAADPVRANSEKAVQWAGQNWETVKFWYETYKVKCPNTTTEILPSVMEFFSHYMDKNGTHGDAYREPVKFFQVSFCRWISNSKRFNKAEPIQDANTPQASGVNRTKRSIGTWAQK